MKIKRITKQICKIQINKQQHRKINNKTKLHKKQKRKMNFVIEKFANLTKSNHSNKKQSKADFKEWTIISGINQTFDDKTICVSIGTGKTK